MHDISGTDASGGFALLQMGKVRVGSEFHQRGRTQGCGEMWKLKRRPFGQAILGVLRLRQEWATSLGRGLRSGWKSESHCTAGLP